MLVVRRQPFDVSERHRSIRGYARNSARGPVFPVSVQFARAQEARPIHADAFLDTGAPYSVVSLLWLAERAGVRRFVELPATDTNGRVQEQVTISVGSSVLRLRDTRLMRQGDTIGDRPPAQWHADARLCATWRAMQELPGFDDVLLGRDFLIANRLLLILDGAAEEPRFSLLFPDDLSNRVRRRLILGLS